MNEGKKVNGRQIPYRKLGDAVRRIGADGLLPFGEDGDFLRSVC